jgi:DNA ligase (NAD+)
MYTKEQTQKLQAVTKKLLKEPGSINELRDVLRFHEHRYYVMDEPLISDFEYDKLYKALEKIEGRNAWIDHAGFSYTKGWQ